MAVKSQKLSLEACRKSPSKYIEEEDAPSTMDGDGWSKELRGLLGHATRISSRATLFDRAFACCTFGLLLSTFSFSADTARVCTSIFTRFNAKQMCKLRLLSTFTIQMPHVCRLNDWREFFHRKSRSENDLKEIIESSFEALF